MEVVYWFTWLAIACIGGIAAILGSLMLLGSLLLWVLPAAPAASTTTATPLIWQKRLTLTGFSLLLAVVGWGLLLFAR